MHKLSVVRPEIDWEEADKDLLLGKGDEGEGGDDEN